MIQTYERIYSRGSFPRSGYFERIKGEREKDKKIFSFIFRATQELDEDWRRRRLEEAPGV